MKQPDKITFSATIPTQQYGNIQPTIEMSGVSIAEAEASVLSYIKDLFARFSSLGALTEKDLKQVVTTKEKKTLGMKKE
jgi:hypothetical protein